MDTAFKATRRANLTGAGWMVLSMALFAVEDALLKRLFSGLPFGPVMILFGLGGAAVFTAHLLATRQALFHPDVLSRPMKLRLGFEVFGRLFYFLAISLAPLSAATVILQSTPLVVVGAAAVLFGEKVGWRRWLAVFIGLSGVVVVLQPSGDSFTAYALLAVLGMLGFAIRDLASRAAPKTLSTSMLGLYGFLAPAIAGAIYMAWSGETWVSPDRTQGMLCIAVILFGVCAYSALMKAMRTGEVGAVTPFRYSRLIFGVGLGVLVFGETLDRNMVIGSGLIVLSGLFILWRGRQQG